MTGRPYVARLDRRIGMRRPARRVRGGLGHGAEPVGSGALTPVIDRTCPPAEAATAVRHLESGHPRGRRVLTV